MSGGNEIVGGTASGKTIVVSVVIVAVRTFTWGGLAGAVTTGAIVGAVAPLAGPVAGTFVAAQFGVASTSALAGLAYLGINFAAGTTATVVGGGVENLVNVASGVGATYQFSPEQALIAGAGNAAVALFADAVSPMVGVHTMAQYAEFAPGAQALVQGTVNGEAVLGSAFIEAAVTVTAGEVAASQPMPEAPALPTDLYFVPDTSGASTPVDLYLAPDAPAVGGDVYLTY